MAKGPSRIDRLVSAMTLAEKIGQLTMRAAGDVTTGPVAGSALADAVRAGQVGHVLNLAGRDRIADLQRIARQETRLGIPLAFGLDVVHGYRTTFPIPLGEAAAFDPVLWERSARAAAREAAADGLSLTFAPMLDVCRDPRWGRIAEGPGEDPWLAALFARAKVRGFQGPGHGRIAPGRLAATAKHIGAYGAVTAGLDYAAVDVSERQLEEVHLPAFRAAVEEGVAALMPSFVALSGVPATADKALLAGEVRGRWRFAGVIISDYHAIAELVQHGVAADLIEAAALALGAGVDIDMMGEAYATGLPVALERGLVTGPAVDAAVRRVLALKERLGLFEEAPHAPPPPRATRQRALARFAATRSMVLLKNAGDVLPLAPTGPPVLLAGPHALGGPDELGPWAALGGAPPTSPLDTIRAALPDRMVDALPPGLLDGTGPLADAPREGVIVLCLGETSAMSGEAASRAEPVLPPEQAALVRKAARLGLPLVLVLWCGRPLVLGDLLEGVDAALVAWFPGSEGPAALADVLCGQREPGGRLPVTWPASVGQIPIFFGQRPTGRPYEPGNPYTSHYLDVPPGPLFPFGHGLTYTRFAMRIRAVAVAGSSDGGLAVRVDVEVANLGERAGQAAVLLFVHDPVARVARPLLELRRVRRLVLPPGATRRIRFRLGAADLSSPGPDMRPVLEPGVFEILVGPSADPRLLERRSIAVDQHGPADQARPA